jgi:hypothetical protein
MYGRLVDAEDDTPLHGRVRVVSPRGETQVVETGPAGDFELNAGSWGRMEARAEAEGHCETVFEVGSEYTTLVRPQLVRLSRAATVDVLVRDRTGASLSGVEVEFAASRELVRRITTAGEPSEDAYPTWTGTTSEDGTLSLSELPARVPLRISFSAFGQAMQQEPEPLVLSSGEHRRIELLAGPGTRITGRLEDERGVPIPWCTVWRIAAKGRADGVFGHSDSPSQVTKTDGSGGFRFDAVPPGTWWVGPPPGAAKGVPAYAMLVDVLAALPDLAIVVRVERDLFLEGLVMSAAGVPVADSTVSASWKRGTASTTTRTDRDGRFSLGPLVAGTWTLEASSTGARSASSEIEAGATGIVLRLGE